MHLLKLCLEGYRRFALTGIRHLTWTPSSRYQVILGSNGSGKSSLMSECSPLPASQADYLKGGKKTAYYEHEGHQYILTSSFASKAEHSFKRDGVDLNTGGTVSIQLQLIETYFNGYNEEIHDILRGYRGFTSMSVADRRRWLTRMSQEDYRYALGLFDRLKVAARDLQGHLKHIRQRLHDETLALKEGPVVESLAPEVASLQAQLTALLYARTPVSMPIGRWQERLTEDHRELNASAEAVTSAAKRLDITLPARSAIALERVLEGLGAELTALDKTLDRYRVDYSDTETVQRALDSAEVDDMASLEAKLVTQRQDIARLEQRFHHFPGLREAADPDALLAVTQEILQPLMDVFSQLPDNTTRWVSREGLQQTSEQRRRQRQAIDQTERLIDEVKAKIHAIEHAEKVTCPACHHQWSLGLDPSALPALQAQLKVLYTQQAAEQESLAATDKSMEAMEAYLVLYRQWKGYVHQYPGLHLLWDHIQTHQYDTHQPVEHRHVFLEWYEELERACTCHQLRHRIKAQEALLAVTPQGERKLLQARLAQLTQSIEQFTRDKRVLLARKKHYEGQLQAYRTWEAAKTRYETALQAMERDYEEGMSSLATHVMDEDIARLQSQLGALQHSLQAQTQRMDRLRTLETDQAKAEKDLEALVLLAKELSPKEGEIAERMHAYMQGWVSTLNFTLRQVWSYDLEVLPCDFGNGDLNYRFPVYLGGGDQPSPDVALTSTSIGHILNFAFHQTFVRYMGLKEVPLFIDELDAHFDDAHRVNLYPYLARLMDGEYYSQLFMISHYHAGWSVFPEAEYVVIDDRNLTSRPPANPNVVMG